MERIIKKEFIQKIFRSHKERLECATKQDVIDFFNRLIGVLFPDYSVKLFMEEEQVEKELLGLRLTLITLLCKDVTQDSEDAGSVVDTFFDALPGVYELLMKDIEAIFKGDPAAKSHAEVIRTYPGFFAIVAYRIAHVLEKEGVTIIPRVITEFAHSQTGIDIHPGAQIGKYFCIDHGTGIVIGETCEIGKHVKIYQGVTLGALSVEKKDAKTKRHPTLEDNVVLYAGATILGGETIIGHDSIVGGNVWLTRSVPPHSKIYYKAQMHNDKEEQTDLFIYKSVEL